MIDALEMPPVMPPESPPVTAQPSSQVAPTPAREPVEEAPSGIKTETELTEIQLSEKVGQDWGETVKMIVTIFEVDPEEVARQLEKDGKPHDGKAVKDEINRRKKDGLYAKLEKVPGLKNALVIRRQVNAVRYAASEAIEKAKKEAAASGTIVSEAAIRARYIKDENGGVYFKLVNADNPTGEEIHYSYVNQPFVEALKVIADETHQPDSQKNPEPTDRAKQARQLYDFFSGRLVDSDDGGHFIDPTPKKDLLRAKEIKKDEGLIIETVIDWLADQPEAVIATYRDDIFEIDEEGKITGVKKDKLREIIGSLPVNGEVGHRLLLLAAYYDVNIQTEQKRNIVALMYHGLKELKSEAVGRLIHADELEKRLNKIKATLMIKYQISEGVALGLEFNHLLRDLTLALVCEGKVTVDEKTRRLILSQDAPKEVKALLDNWKADPTERSFIVQLASEQGAVMSFLSNVFGIDTKVLTDNNTMRSYVGQVIDKIIERKGLDKENKINEKTVYQEVFNHHVSDDTLKNLADKRGFPKGMGMGLMLLLIFAPSFQKLLEDLGGADRGGQQPEGG